MESLNYKDKYYTYVRVSSERQTEGMSLEEQTRQVRLFAERKGFEVAQEFVEVDSASELNRPVFTEMISKIDANIAGVIFHSIDRSARNLFDQSKIYTLIQNGHNFHFVAENLSTDNPSARGMILIMWGMASSFTENLKMHVNKGIMGMLNDGRCPNPAPIGYIDKGKGVKEPDPVNGPLVRKLFEYYATGNYDIVKLTKKMYSLGLRNKAGKMVNDKVLYKLLRKKFYYGIITYRDTEYQGSHGKLITKSLFDKVQLELDARSFKKKRLHLYIFQGMIKCPSCLKAMRSISAKRRYKYYNCRTPDCTFRKTIRETEVEAAFLDELKKLEFTDDEVAMFLKAVAQFRKDLWSSNAEQVKQIDMEISKISKTLELLLSKFLEEKVADDDYKLMKSKYLNKRQELQERKDALTKADEEICNQIAEIGKLLKKPLHAYFLAQDDGKRGLVKSLVENVTLINENPIIHWLKEFEVIQNRPKPVDGSATGNRTPICWMKTSCPNH